MRNNNNSAVDISGVIFYKQVRRVTTCNKLCFHDLSSNSFFFFLLPFPDPAAAKESSSSRPGDPAAPRLLAAP